MERLMTTEEVAELLRIEAVTVRRLIGRGELSAYRVAGEYRVAPADLEKFMQAQRVVVDVRPRNEFSDRFTNQARGVLTLANEEARRYNHPSVGTEHMLLALMGEEDGIAAQALSRLGIQPDAIRARIEELHPARDKPLGEGMIGLTAQGKTSIELSVQEARDFDHHYLGTEHLLLGILREPGGLGGQVLRQADITLDQAREQVRQLLATQRTANEPPSE